VVVAEVGRLKSVSDAGGCSFIRREVRFYISLYRVVTFRLYSLTRGLGTSRVPTLLVSPCLACYETVRGAILTGRLIVLCVCK
jgi:hypothetical protein